MKSRRSSGPAFVFLEDGTFVNEVLVREGLAHAVPVAGSARGAQLQQAETAARTAGRGLWDRLAGG